MSYCIWKKYNNAADNIAWIFLKDANIDEKGLYLEEAKLSRRWSEM